MITDHSVEEGYMKRSTSNDALKNNILNFKSSIESFDEIIPETTHLPSKYLKNALLKDVSEKELLQLNIGGMSYKLRVYSILLNGSKTLLGKFCTLSEEQKKEWCDLYFEESNEYFFERDPLSFGPIYEFYSTGVLHVPNHVCFDKFIQELEYWNISKTKLDQNCSPFYRFYESLQNRSRSLESQNFGESSIERYRYRLHLIFEGGVKSTFWVALIIGSMEEFQTIKTRKKTDIGEDDLQGQMVSSKGKHGIGYIVSSNTILVDDNDDMDMEEHWILFYIEKVCVIFFTFEYLLRLWVSPEKTKFIKKFINVIDLLTIIPFIFELLFFVIGIDGNNIRKITWAVLTVRLLKVMRVFRIVKLGRFSTGMAKFGKTLSDSKRQLEMIIIVILTSILFFSTLIYFLEKNVEETKFKSIPITFWWAIVTMTTGYGEMAPCTVMGKIVGAISIIFGIMIFSMPITILVIIMSAISSAPSTSLSPGKSITKHDKEKRKKKTDLFLGKTIQDLIDLINDNGLINECSIKLKKVDMKKIVTFEINAGKGKLLECVNNSCNCKNKSIRYVTSDGTSLLSSNSQSTLSSKNDTNSRNRLTNTSISDCRCGCASGKDVTSYTSTDTSNFNSDIFSATTETSEGSSPYNSTTNSYVCNNDKVRK
uniref:BTB domain-containing protein n=2 Tax=Strongyloides stercoralis TaxID=6248 RepID=A0AAF5D7C6_STRER